MQRNATSWTGTRTLGSWLGLGSTLALSLATASTAHAATTQLMASTKALLEIDGAPVAWLHAYEGGAAVVSVSAAGDGGSRKGGGGVRYEELTIEVDLQPALTGWVKDLLAGKAGPRSGAIVSCDANLKSLERFSFTSASLSKVTFSKLDAGEGKAPLLMTLVLAPTRTQVEPTKGEQCKMAATPAKGGPMASNFSFQLDGVDGTGVISVAGLEVTQLGSGARVLSNLQLRISAARAAELIAWHQQAVNGKPSAKKLSIVLLDPTLKNQVARFDANGVRSIRVARERFEAGASRAASVTAELHLESLELTPPTP